MAKKILIIDDELDNTMIVVYRLSSKGYEVMTARTSREGIALAREYRPDLIFLDYHLADADAKDVASQIRACEGNAQVPMILFTADLEKVADKTAACGAVDYILKPVPPELLYAKVKKQIG